jgi:ribosomal-protein-alanine N-acetyltransferase
VSEADVSTALTPRMRGTVPGAGDLEFLCALLGDPRVGETLGGVRDRRASGEILASHQAAWVENGFGYWIWRDRETGEPVARGGPSHATVEGKGVVEIGWAVVAERWGQGLATELGRASIDAAARLGIPQVVAYTLPQNTGSRRVMEKLGMTYDRTFVNGSWGPHVLYLTDVDPAPRHG